MVLKPPGGRPDRKNRRNKNPARLPSSTQIKNRPSGQPKAGRRAGFDVFPTGIRPKSNPESRLRTILVRFRCVSTTIRSFYSVSVLLETQSYVFNFSCWAMFCPKLAPGPLVIGSGSRNGAKRTQNQPRGPILMSFRDSVVVHS